MLHVRKCQTRRTYLQSFQFKSPETDYKPNIAEPFDIGRRRVGDPDSSGYMRSGRQYFCQFRLSKRPHSTTSSAPNVSADSIPAPKRKSICNRSMHVALDKGIIRNILGSDPIPSIPLLRAGGSSYAIV